MNRKNRRSIVYRTGLALSFLAVSLMLAQPFLSPLQAQAAVNQNPSFAEISQKLEDVALEKDIPSVILKGIAYKESSWRQFDSKGNPLLAGSSTRPSIGIMQVTSYDHKDTATVERLKYDIDFNIRMGADILNQKWETAPRIGDGDRNKLENWYFALWAYNSWSNLNNPNQRTTTPAYQDRVLNLIADPGSVDARLIPYMQPVSVSRIPAASLPGSGVPARDSSWATPQPVHLGDVVDFSYPELQRLAGTNRIDTAIQQSKSGWPQGSSTVVLARSDDFPDALAGVPLAGYYDAPVLLTGSRQLDPKVAQEIRRLNPDQIYLLGGEGALGPEVSAALAGLGWDSSRQIRLSGEDRYETANEIALALDDAKARAGLPPGGETLPDGQTPPDGETLPDGQTLPGGETLPDGQTPPGGENPSDDQSSTGGETLPDGQAEAPAGTAEAVVLATGQNFPDALSVASAAGREQMPILLTGKNQLADSTLETLIQLDPAEVYIIGGEGVISPQVEQQVISALGLETAVVRLGGTNRYSTSARVAEYFDQPGSGLHLATGENFPDALSGAALAVHQQSMLVLVPENSLRSYPELEIYLDTRWSSLSQVTLLGGTSVISDVRTRELWSLGK